MVEPKRLHVKLSFDVSNPIRVHTDLSMFATSPEKISPDRAKIEKMRKLSTSFRIDKQSLSKFIETEEPVRN